MRFVLHCDTHARTPALTHWQKRTQSGRVRIHYTSTEKHGNGVYWFPLSPRLVKHVEFGCRVMKLPSLWRMSGKRYSWREAPQWARAVNTAPVCIALIQSQRRSFLSQSTLFFFFFPPAPIRALIHLLFISSVALNDVNDLLWTVRESIWTLSNTIRHSAPGCSRGSALLAQRWQIKRDWPVGLWMDPGAHGHVGTVEPESVCVCVCEHSTAWRVLSKLTKAFWVWSVMETRNDEVEWVGTERTYEYKVLHVPGMFETTGSVCVCVSQKLTAPSQ